MKKLYTFGQNEADWKNWLINGVPGSTLGKYGCTTTAYGVALGYYIEKPMDPQDTEIFIRNAGGYQGDLILWSKLPYFRQRFDCKTTPAPLEDIKNEIRSGKLVLLQVDLVGNDDKPDHWVLCLDENFTIFDPWFNEVAPITKRYGEPSREIFGGAYFNWPINNTNTMPTDAVLLKDLKDGKVNEYHLPDGTVGQLIYYKSREDFLAMGCKDENLIDIDEARPQVWRDRLDSARQLNEHLNAQVISLQNELSVCQMGLVQSQNDAKQKGDLVETYSAENDQLKEHLNSAVEDRDALNQIIVMRDATISGLRAQLAQTPVVVPADNKSSSWGNLLDKLLIFISNIKKGK